MGILSYLKLGTIAVVVIALAVLFGLWQMERAKNASLAARVSTLQAVNDENVAELAKVKKDAAEEVAATKAQLDFSQAMANQTLQIDKVIIDAKPADLGHVPRAIGAAIDRLYKRPADHPNQGSATSHP